MEVIGSTDVKILLVMKICLLHNVLLYAPKKQTYQIYAFRNTCYQCMHVRTSSPNVWWLFIKWLKINLKIALIQCCYIDNQFVNNLGYRTQL